jgi:hypothetical protein
VKLLLRGMIVAGLMAAPAAAQQAKKWMPPRTPDGRPDLNGIWSNATITPLERPPELAGKQYFTEEEAGAYEKRMLRELNRDRRSSNPDEDLKGAYNELWFDRGIAVVPTRRTSLVVDPPDGRVPSLTPAARKAGEAREGIASRPPEGPQDLTPIVRCLVWPTSIPPMLPTAYNNNYQIVQTPGYVAILAEMIHDVRIIPIDGRSHLPATVRQWFGDSIGRWEGDTLVVDTTNFTGKTNVSGSDENLHVIERFTQTGENTILYEFTVDDPTAFTRVWKGEVPMTRAPGPIYEYACHEGNYSMESILKGAAAAVERKKFIGVWNLMSGVSRDRTTGEVRYPWGEHPVGRLSYDESGHVFAQLMNPNRGSVGGKSDRGAAAAIASASAEDMREMLTGFNSYFGTFDVDVPSRTVIHHLQSALIPSWVGTDQRRQYEFSGRDELIILNTAGGADYRLVWHRD